MMVSVSKADAQNVIRMEKPKIGTVPLFPHSLSSRYN